ncbi:MAG: hypothetical protein R3B09_23715 [Nannocystaceae bacterium]|nr:hypothetical protein [Myxococcales bacterium]
MAADEARLPALVTCSYQRPYVGPGIYAVVTLEVRPRASPGLGWRVALADRDAPTIAAEVIEPAARGVQAAITRLGVAAVDVTLVAYRRHEVDSRPAHFAVAAEWALAVALAGDEAGARPVGVTVTFEGSRRRAPR